MPSVTEIDRADWVRASVLPAEVLESGCLMSSLISEDLSCIVKCSEG